MSGKTYARQESERKRAEDKAEEEAKIARRPNICGYGCSSPPTVFVDYEDRILAFCGPHSIEFERDVFTKKCAEARSDFNVFAEMVCTDDETGEPIKQAPIHRRWAHLADKHDRLIIWSHVEAGKTVQLSILRTVWELGNNTKLRFVVLSDTSIQATMIVRSIASYIESNETVKKIFPNLERDPNGTWTSTALQVKRPNRAKDPSVRAAGFEGALTGGRIDRLIIDDLLDEQNSNNPSIRKALKSWVVSTAFSRLTKNAKVLIVGNAWHPEDFLHELAATGQYKWVRFPILDKNGNVTWPEAWSAERIEKKRKDCLTAEEFARSMLCQARDDASARFKQADIDRAVTRGRTLSLVHSLAELPGATANELPEGCSTFTGVDLAMSKKKKSDDTVFFTFMEDKQGNRTVLNIEIGKFSAPQIVEKILDHHRRYKSTIAVESNAAQAFILDFTRELSNVPILPHLTTKAKRDPLLGVESLAIELANGKWIIPSHIRTVPEVDRWIREMLFYSPHAHTGDVLMACYFARELARRILGVVSSGTGVSLKTYGTEAKTAEDKQGTFQERITKVSEISDEEAMARDGRAIARA